MPFLTALAFRVTNEDKQDRTQKSFIAETILNGDNVFAHKMTEHLYFLLVNHKNLL